MVFIINTLYLRLQQVITTGPLAAQDWMLPVLRKPVICRRGDIQLVAYRSDPVLITQGIHQGAIFPQAVELRLRKISGSLAQDIVAAAQLTNFQLQLFQALAFSGGEATINASCIAFILTQPDKQGIQPILGAMELMAAH